MGSELTITGEQETFTDTQVAALEQIGVKDAKPGDLAVFFHQVQRTGLDPFAKQIYMIERKGKQTIQTGIDGFRLIARRAVDRTHETFGEPQTLWCGDDAVWRDVWLGSVPPSAAKVVVQRGEGIFVGTARFESYAGRKYDGSLAPIWASKPDVMIAKCAEALALRKAFPLDLSGLLTPEELDHDGVDAKTSEQSDGPVTPSPSRDDCKRISQFMVTGGVKNREDAAAALKALTGRDIHGTDELTMVEAEQLLSAPDLIIQRTAATLNPKEPQA
ncbi:MAG: RecT family recombinase [Bifidobacterium mongoliense]|jgi:phage recombination protein Bet|uniref:RecT family recombinase n=1 Tax=Bifidobacterium mongoliense TaxID=518643 RepID=UPI002F358635